jgi:cytochrome c oxidase cbb3-type subunit III
MRLLALLLALPLLGQHEQMRKPGEKHPFIGNATAIAAGLKLFNGGCAGCHGANGQGGRGPNLAGGLALWHSRNDDEYFGILRKGISGGGMPGSTLPDDDLWRVVAYVRSLRAPASELDVPGNKENGQVIFHGKGGCANCHAVAGNGGRIGPDLSNIGATRPLTNLRESILDPDSDGAFGFRRATVSFRDTARAPLSGVLRNQSNYSLQLIDSSGDIRLVEMRDVATLKVEDSSPMPKDFRTRLTKDELTDLLAWLSRLSTRKD